MYACMKEHVHLLSQNWSFACGRQREQIWLRLARKYYVNTYQKHMHNSALSHVGAIKNRPIARRNTSIRVRVNVSDLKMPFRSGSMFFFSYSFSLLILDVSLFSYVQHAWQRIHCLFYYSHTHTHGPLADPWIGSIVVNLKRITALALPYPCHIISQAHRRNCH